jgi:hypothetical protein
MYMKRESQLCALVVSLSVLYISLVYSSACFYYGGWCECCLSICLLCVCNCVETVMMELQVGWSSASQCMIIVNESSHADGFHWSWTVMCSNDDISYYCFVSHMVSSSTWHYIVICMNKSSCCSFLLHSYYINCSNSPLC